MWSSDHKAVMSLITVITASIGRDDIKHAYRSLVDQTDPDWRWIIAGDGIRPPVFHDGRVRAFKLPHMAHEAHMRNIGVEVAQTPWVTFLDDDDTLAPTFIATMTDIIMHKPDVDVIYVTQVGPSGKLFPSTPGVTWGEVGISYACRRELAQEFPFQPVLHEDFEQVLAFEGHGATFHWHLGEPLYLARHHGHTGP